MANVHSSWEIERAEHQGWHRYLLYTDDLLTSFLDQVERERQMPKVWVKLSIGLNLNIIIDNAFFQSRLKVAIDCNSTKDGPALECDWSLLTILDCALGFLFTPKYWHICASSMYSSHLTFHCIWWFYTFWRAGRRIWESVAKFEHG